MKTHTFRTRVAGAGRMVVMAGCSLMPAVWLAAPLCYAEVAAVSSNLPKNARKAIETGDYAAVQKALLNYLKKQEITPNNASVLHASMVLEWIRITTPEVLSDMAKDVRKRKFLQAFARDAEWLELYLTCGLVPWQTPVGMDVLFRIWYDEKGKVADKKLAVALASVWGGGEGTPEPNIAKKNPNKYNPLWRYKFFRKQHKSGKLVRGYDKLRPWELRFVVGIAHQPWDDASFEYCAKHLNMPPDQFGEAYKAVTYVGRSKFGESVHNSTMYYLPYPDMSTAEVTMRTGGVCGSQGHLGACVAMAHGVPAYTCGQPGHCAYGVRFRRGEWLDGNADFDTHEPSGMMHNYIFSEQSPTSTHLMETVFGNDEVIAKAYRESFCAWALAATDRPQEAMKMWEQTLTTSPFHAHFRRDMHKLMRAQGLCTPENVRQYLLKTLPLYKTHGFAAADMMKDLEDVVAQLPDAQKLEIFSELHRMMSGSRYHDAVRCEGILERQDKMLEKPESHEKLLTLVFNHHMSQGDGYPLGQFLEWAVKNYLQKGQEDVFTRAFNAAVNSAADNEQQSGKVTKPLRKAYCAAIAAVQKAHSVAGFQAISKAAMKAMSEQQETTPLSKPASIPGTGIEGECLLFISSADYWGDTPWLHGGVVSSTGGNCMTAAENKPCATVEMAGAKVLTGCVIRKGKRGGDIKKANVAVSTDGVNWTTVATSENMPQEWAPAFPAGTRGRFIRLESDNGNAKRVLHLSHFLVFRQQ